MDADDLGFDLDFGSCEDEPNGSPSVSANSFDDDVKGFVNTDELIQRYNELKEQSEKIDNNAKEIRMVLSICKQMEMCYSRRVMDGLKLKNSVEVRYLHDGTILLILEVHNASEYLMDGWILNIRSKFPCVENDFLSSSTQSIPIGSLLPHNCKKFEISAFLSNIDCPILFFVEIVKELRLDDENENISRIFRIPLDTICFTYWDMVELSPEMNINLSFSFSVRLSHTLIDLLCGCPDTVSPVNVFRAILPERISKIIDSSEFELNLRLFNDGNKWAVLKMKVTKEPSCYILSICTDSSNMQNILKNNLYFLLTVKMSVLKNRPENSITILPEMAGIEEIFEALRASF